MVKFEVVKLPKYIMANTKEVRESYCVEVKFDDGDWKRFYTGSGTKADAELLMLDLVIYGC